MTFLQRAGIGSIALWRLGAEDPSVWKLFGRDHRTLPPASVIDTIPAGTDVDIEGPGEILKVAARPSPASGPWSPAPMARSPTCASIACRHRWRWTVPAIARTARADLRRWTGPQVDAADPRRAEARTCPGTFFIVGENALTQRPLLQRMIMEGHEIGSHTYTHPNLATSSPGQVLFELNANQRLFQAFTADRCACSARPISVMPSRAPRTNWGRCSRRRTAAMSRRVCTSIRTTGSGRRAGDHRPHDRARHGWSRQFAPTIRLSIAAAM